MRIFNTVDTAAAENHVVFCQSARLIREKVLDLTQVLCNVESPALDPGVQLLVVQGQVILDEVHLSQFDNLDRHI